MAYNSHLSSSVKRITVGEEAELVDNEIRTLLNEYLIDQKTLDELRDWVALNIWEAPADQYNEVDVLAIELAHLDDGIADEQYFRVQLWALLGVIFIEAPADVDPYVPLTGTTAGATHVPTYSGIESPHNPNLVRADHSFA